jgi:hypothetical protein
MIIENDQLKFSCKGESGEKNIAHQYLENGADSLGGSVSRISFKLRSRVDATSYHYSKI